MVQSHNGRMNDPYLQGKESRGRWCANTIAWPPGFHFPGSVRHLRSGRGGGRGRTFLGSRPSPPFGWNRPRPRSPPSWKRRRPRGGRGLRTRPRGHRPAPRGAAPRPYGREKRGDTFDAVVSGPPGSGRPLGRSCSEPGRAGRSLPAPRSPPWGAVLRRPLLAEALPEAASEPPRSRLGTHATNGGENWYTCLGGQSGDI